MFSGPDLLELVCEEDTHWVMGLQFFLCLLGNDISSGTLDGRSLVGSALPTPEYCLEAPGRVSG